MTASIADRREQGHALMIVQAGRYVAPHGRFEVNRQRILDLANGDHYGTLSRGFSCACGHQLLDGDPYVENDDGQWAHIGCAHLVGVEVES